MFPCKGNIFKVLLDFIRARGALFVYKIWLKKKKQ